ncbi:MAG: DNA translocase FtsK 4TM domain-containing protein [Clostridia bacterium]|jgi:S-DNA-T family DNA segregation ATPase FtsK/SpoIIIE|nr:DNA translocase FtsK 4TM domain-containing protein [Clostridia bacterium]
MERKNPRAGEEIKNDLIGVIFIALSLFIFFCIWQGIGDNQQTMGAVGSFIYRTINSLSGEGKILIPLILLIIGIAKLFSRVAWNKFTLVSWAVLWLAILGLLHLKLPDVQQTFESGWAGDGGGVIGVSLSRAAQAMFGKVGSYILFIACVVISVMGIARKPLLELIKQVNGSIVDFFGKTKVELFDFLIDTDKDDEEEDLKPPPRKPIRKKAEESDLPLIIDHTLGQKETVRHDVNQSPALVKGHLRLVKDTAPDMGKEEEFVPVANAFAESFQLPPIDLLQFVARAKSQRLNKDITDNVRILEETLDNFGVKARVTQVSRGPSITRYEIQPPPGIKVSKIVNLVDDIALSLAAAQVRIEAPIPGKAAVGIEVPNEEIAVVTMREVLESPLFQESDSYLTVALGKDIAGNAIVADLAKMPHLLIAGATGSGKSVCMNTVIGSILFKAKPDQVKMLMIDPKVVELSNFNGIPHLISPVVTDPKKAATSLRWAVHEMENRYELFAGLGVKDIIRYNQAKSKENKAEGYPLLPYIVVFIDELADLMMVAPADVEDAICRLAQMARAAGIHLVVATQRPSVDVITGVIKANIPSRISFAVSSQTDSRTILDMGGAERLLGRGDMLFYPTGMPKPIRVQGAYVSDTEIDNLVNFLKEQRTAQYITPWTEQEKLTPESGEEDELLGEAARIFIESGQASISLLQRRLRIGYTRAARIIDQLEEKGIVGAYEGSKPRNIRMTWEEYERVFGKESC